MWPQRLCVDHPLRLSRPVDTRIQHTATSETWSDYTSQSTWQPMEVGEEVIGIHPLDNTCRCALTVACQGRKNCNWKILRLAVVPAPAEDPSFWWCRFCRNKEVLWKPWGALLAISVQVQNLCFRVQTKVYFPGNCQPMTNHNGDISTLPFLPNTELLNGRSSQTFLDSPGFPQNSKVVWGSSYLILSSSSTEIITAAWSEARPWILSIPFPFVSHKYDI